MNTAKPNRLSEESSPYLKQHALNPVDWYPWGEEAFEKARAENKPIFLSIGYSSCHWCHVMERESFESDEIAEILNESFVSVKVDREERPDVDQIYMDAVIAMTGQGGWPLTVFLTPELKPFFGGTYFPPSGRYGRPGFKELIESVASGWKEQGDKLIEGADKVTEFIESMRLGEPHAEDAVLTSDTLDKPLEHFRQQFDSVHAGFGSAPKFPPDSGIDYLLRQFRRKGDKEALEMALNTLRKMARGGLFDQLGGGFHRYSTDEKWLVPHFEKMLYNQATLAPLYLDAWLITGDEELKETAVRTLDYVLRELTDESGGFYSATDADSEGVEGKFFVWTKEELDEVLGEKEAALFADFYDVGPDNVFEGMGSILHVDAALGEFSRATGENPLELASRLEKSRVKLLSRRNDRVAPGLDDKVLTGWNAMMIIALCRGFKALDEMRWLQAAERAGHFILDSMWSKDNRLLRVWGDGEAKIEGNLEDYAWTVAALMELYECDFEPAWLEAAEMICKKMLELFYDPEGGGFYFTDGTDKTLIVRTRQLHDNAYPSPSGIAVRSLFRLSAYSGIEIFARIAEEALHRDAQALEAHGYALPTMLSGLESLIHGVPEIAIVCPDDDPHGRELLKTVRGIYRPDAVLMFAMAGDIVELQERWPLLRGREPLEGRAAAYVCENYICLNPTSDAELLARQLREM